MKSRWFDIAKLVISLSLLAFVLTSVGVHDTLESLRTADTGLLWLALALFIFGVYLRAFRWRALLADRRLHVPIGVLTRLYFIGQFFNTFLPTGFGGDVVRVVELARYGVSKAESVSTVFLDRLSGLMAFFIMTLFALPFAGHLIPAGIQWVLVVFGVAGIVGTGLLFERRFTTRWVNSLLARFSFPFKAKVARLYESVRANSPRATAQAMFVGFVFNVLLVFITFLVAQAFQVKLGLGYFFLFVPIISTLLLLPVSLNGLGVREGAYVVLFGSVGINHATAVSMSLAFWGVTVGTGLIGGVLYALQGMRGALKLKIEE